MSTADFWDQVYLICHRPAIYNPSGQERPQVFREIDHWRGTWVSSPDHSNFYLTPPKNPREGDH